MKFKSSINEGINFIDIHVDDYGNVTDDQGIPLKGVVTTGLRQNLDPDYDKPTLSAYDSKLLDVPETDWNTINNACSSTDSSPAKEEQHSNTQGTPKGELDKQSKNDENGKEPGEGQGKEFDPNSDWQDSANSNSGNKGADSKDQSKEGNSDGDGSKDEPGKSGENGSNGGKNDPEQNPGEKDSTKGGDGSEGEQKNSGENEPGSENNSQQSGSSNGTQQQEQNSQGSAGSSSMSQQFGNGTQSQQSGQGGGGMLQIDPEELKWMGKILRTKNGDFVRKNKAWVRV